MENKKTICHLTTDDVWGGAEVMVHNILKTLKKYNDIKIIAILLNDGKLAGKLRDLGIDTYVVDEKKYALIQIVWQIRKLIHSKNINIIHSHGYRSGVISFLSSIFFNSVKNVRTIHNSMIKRKGQKWSVKRSIVKFVDIFSLKYFYTVITTVSYEIKDSLIKKYKISKGKVITIHNGIDVNQEKKGNNRDVKISKIDTFNIGSAGRLVPIKNYSFMIEIARCFKDIKSIAFLLAGDGMEDKLLKSKVKEMQLGNMFLFQGHIENMSGYYKKLHLYLNTSLHEGLPMSIMEAMFNGLPVIAPDAGGIGEIVEDGVTGFLLKDYNSQNYADKIYELYNNPELLIQMSQASIEKINSCFSITATTEKYHAIYTSI